jgi:L-alanine-DL-glutamate epimerase-like enolase superfamily enzyme
MKRRNFINTIAAPLAASAFLPGYKALIYESRKLVKITDMKVMQVKGNIFTYPMVKIETDAGITGIGEGYWGGGVADIMRTHLKKSIIGENPLDIERLYTKMVKDTSGAGSIGGATITAISGVEIALWDLAGKILQVPVYQLLGGKYRDSVKAYWTISPGKGKDAISEFAAMVKSHPYGLKALKVEYFRDNKPANGALSPTLTMKELAANEEGFGALREALGIDYDFSVHCHWEFDWKDSLALARAVAHSKPWWLEDPMPPDFSDTWVRLTEESPVPILTGENLYTRQGFLPFITKQGCHIIQPDIPKAGGLLECKKIGDLASLYNIPMCGHGVSTPLGLIASAHCAATVRDFIAHEARIDWESAGWAKFVIYDRPIFKDGRIQLSDKPGYGVELNEDYVRANLAPGEVWWG